MKTAIKCVKKGKCFPRRLSEIDTAAKKERERCGERALRGGGERSQETLRGRRVTGQQRNWAKGHHHRVESVVPRHIQSTSGLQGSRCDTHPPQSLSLSSLAVWHVSTPSI
jgi:hypothetical protein